MTNGSWNWTWQEIEPLARVIAEVAGEAILCGGQAVAFWASRFGLGVVVSRDLDVLGEREDATRFSERVGGVIRFPDRYEMTILAAVIRAIWMGRRLDIEWLNSVPGIETDPEAISVAVDLGCGQSVRVLHPVALGIGKLHALRYFDQQGRNDAMHLRLAVQATAAWLADRLETDSAGTLRLVHRWYRAARMPGNRRVLSDLAIDWREAVPVAVLEARARGDSRIARFMTEHWPRLAGEDSAKPGTAPA